MERWGGDARQAQLRRVCHGILERDECLWSCRFAVAAQKRRRRVDARQAGARRFLGRIIGRGQPGLRVLLELPAVAVVLGLVGLACQAIGYGRLLPGVSIPMFVAIGCMSAPSEFITYSAVHG